MIEKFQPEHLGLLGGLGALIGIGQMLVGSEVLTLRLVVGRALVSGGLGAASATALLMFPEMGLTALLGISAALSSLGTSGLERMFQKYVLKQG